MGAHCSRRLVAAGYHPVTYHNLSTGHLRFAAGSLVTGDLLDKVAVVHVAAASPVVESVADPQKYYRNNVVGALSLLEAMRKAGCQRLVFPRPMALQGHVGDFAVSGDDHDKPDGTAIRDYVHVNDLAAAHVVKPRRPGDPTYPVADPSAVRETLKFRPAYSDLATIIRTAWAWHRTAHPHRTDAPLSPTA